MKIFVEPSAGSAPVCCSFCGVPSTHRAFFAEGQERVPKQRTAMICDVCLGEAENLRNRRAIQRSVSTLAVEAPGASLTVEAPDHAACRHGIAFDEADIGLGASEVQKRWPRGFFTAEKPCPLGCDFRGIYYASYAHYIAGDW